MKLGEKNLGGAPISDQENIPGLRNVRPLRKVASECSLRVDSPNVEFHGDVAARCLEAAEKCGGNTTLYAYEFIPECRGVLTGKVAEGQVAQFGEACAAGLSYVKGRCVKPVVKNAECDEAPGGMLGDPKDHPRCEAGAECIQLGFGSDGNPLVFKCLASQAIGDACKLDLNACTSGTSCYQGKCRAKAALGGECMAEADCGAGLGCDIKGGVFGKCIERRSSIHSCDPPKP